MPAPHESLNDGNNDAETLKDLDVELLATEDAHRSSLVVDDFISLIISRTWKCKFHKRPCVYIAVTVAFPVASCWKKPLSSGKHHVKLSTYAETLFSCVVITRYQPAAYEAHQCSHTCW